MFWLWQSRKYALEHKKYSFLFWIPLPKESTQLFFCMQEEMVKPDIFPFLWQPIACDKICFSEHYFDNTHGPEIQMLTL